VIARTKSDLADADTGALVEDEIRALVRGSFLANARLVAVSAVTGAASQHPERFVHGLPKRIEAPSTVWINSPAGPQPLRPGQDPPPETTTIDTSVSH
jgi:hypothetical protein